jgi:DHA2 family multidrug resistance protein
MSDALAIPASFPVRAQRAAINPWFIAITVTLATFMELLDTAIANVALPHIAGGLAVSYDESTWVLTSYLVANAVVLPLSAWLSRVFGRKRYYMACVVLFTISSFLCGIAPSLGLLIFFRILQGVGGGGLAPVEQAILVDTFPASKRAAAFALYSMAIVTAPVVGPPLGGWITDNWSWRWVFFINIPIGIISVILTSRLVSDPPEFTREVEAARRGGKLKIDGLGIVLIAIGFACLEVVLDRGQIDDWFESEFISVFFVIAIIALIVAVVWEWRHPDPVVEIRLLRDRNFALASVFYFLFGFALFGSTVLIPQMLQQLYGYTATDAGLVLGPGALVIVVLAPVVVSLLPKVGVRPLIGVGYCIFAVAMWHFASFDLGADYRHFAMARALQGLGIAPLFVSGKPGGLLLLAQEQKQQSLEPHESLPQSRCELRHCFCHHNARAADAIPPIHPRRAHYKWRLELPQHAPFLHQLFRHPRLLARRCRISCPSQTGSTPSATSVVSRFSRLLHSARLDRANRCSTRPVHPQIRPRQALRRALMRLRPLTLRSAMSQS